MFDGGGVVVVVVFERFSPYKHKKGIEKIAKLRLGNIG